MDNQGFISIDYLFSIFLIILIAIGILYFSESTLNSAENIEKTTSYRLFLDNIADEINQVNSNGANFSKVISLPYKIQDNSYVLTLSGDSLTLDIDNRKASTNIFPIKLENNLDVELYGGNSYLIKKEDENTISVKRWFI
ncbi:MAG: hypothetical protein K8V75_04780 [Methanobrevibacter woesei]|nr:hypothetical protein [Methanobrevibacter woesei]